MISAPEGDRFDFVIRVATGDELPAIVCTCM